MGELNFIENIQNVCRLCLRSEEDMVDIFSSKDFCNVPLIERIFLYYQVKISKEDGLPNKICRDCCKFMDTFTKYRKEAHRCEAKLQELLCTAGALGNRIKHNKSNLSEDSGRQTSNYTEILPDEDCEVIVVDPNQEFESSDESFSEDDYSSPPSINTPQPASAPVQEEPIIHAPVITESVTNNINNNDNETEIVDLELENRNTFLCSFCDMAFTVATECAEHERVHDSQFPYDCSSCAFKCADRQLLINHIKENHNDKPYVCAVCKKGFGRRSDLKKHAIVHTGVRPFSCSICGKSFSRNTNLTKHMRIHTGMKPFVCQKCPRSFTNLEDLDKHQKIHEFNTKPFKCQKCNAGFNRKDKLESHLRIHLKKEANEAFNQRLNQSEQVQIGNLVNSRASNTSDFGNDLRVPGLGNTAIGTNYQSESMPYEQYNKNTMISSIMLNPSGHSEFLTKNQQQQLFENRVQLMQQSQNQTQMFLTGNQMQQVMAQQVPDITQIQPFSMENIIMPPSNPLQSGINLASSFKMPIQQPKIKVEPEKPKRSGIHTCSVCAKTFTRKRELQRHSAVHSGQKPFACSFCGKRFNRNDKLVRHEKIHLDGKFPCPKCKLDFTKQESLDIHLQLHEKVERAANPQPAQHEEQTQPKPPNFLQSLQVGITPQLNFYSDTI